jgi:hypothetical protein
MQTITKLKRGERGVIARLDGDPHFLSRITAIGLDAGLPRKNTAERKTSTCPALQPGHDERPQRAGRRKNYAGGKP